MAESISAVQITTFLQELGKRFPHPATLYLVGGSALILLGGSRRTLDIDYVGIDIPGLWTELQRSIDQLAQEMNLDVEAVPYQEMIPVPSEAAQRHIFIGQFGLVSVFAFDPYSMALGKLDRGFPTDLQDVLFMLNRNLIQLSQLVKTVQDAIPVAPKYDLNPNQMQKNLDTVRQMLKH